jgi:hypothetical protein
MSQTEFDDRMALPGLVIGLDFGTTGGKIAFQKVTKVYEDGKLHLIAGPDDKIHMLAGFPGYRQANISTIPTLMMLREDGKVIKWGHEAVNHREKHAFDPRYEVTNWKLKLHDFLRQGDIGEMAQRFGKRPEDFATDWVGAVFQYLFESPRSCLLGHFAGDLGQFNFIDVVIALPPA